MPATEIRTRPAAPAAQLIRRSLDEEMWQKLDRKLAEREAVTTAGRPAAPGGWLARIARGMGLRRE